MTKIFAIKTIEIGGEVEKRFAKLLPILAIISASMSLIVPIIIIISKIQENIIISSFLMLWILWYIISFLSLNKVNLTNNIITIFLFFPFLMPIYLTLRITCYILKRKYPNSDDENDIKNFYRLKKLKSIL